MSVAVRDDTGRELELAAPASRVVSLVPSLTELVCDLGAAAALVGVTSFCTEPPEVVAGLAKVGGTKNPDVDAISALAPDLVLVDRDENRLQDFAALEAAGLPVYVAEVRSAAATAETVRSIGELLGRREPAERLAAEIAAALRHPPATSARVFCPIWRNPWMAFNRHTYAADLLAQCGGVNVCNDLEPAYPQVTLAQIGGLAPDIVLLPDEPYVFAEKHIKDLAELDDTPAGRQRRFHLVDGKAMFWYGRRTIGAVAELRRLIAGT